MSEPVEIHPGVHWVGAKHPDLKIFDELFPTHNGTTYNAYLVRGETRTALVETVKEPFTEEFLAKLESLVPLDQIDLVVINHSEPDHTGALASLLERNPSLTVCCSKPAENFLAQLLNRPFERRVVQDGDRIDLGGRTLRFILAPFLHWPDTMFTYLEEEGILFPCDAFGAHYCPKNLFDDEIPDYSQDFHFYFDSIMRPFKEKIREALAKLEEMEIAMICPSHGPILRKDPAAVIDTYRRWAAPPPANGRPRVLQAVLSSHGNTREMAAAIREGLEGNGVQVEEIAISGMRDNDFRDELERADLLMVGTPTINRDAPPPVWHALALLSSVTPKAKVGAVFGSFGWSGEAVRMIEERLKSLKYELAVPSLSFRFRPTEEDMDTCRAFGEQVARALNGQS